MANFRFCHLFLNIFLAFLCIAPLVSSVSGCIAVTKTTGERGWIKHKTGDRNITDAGINFGSASFDRRIKLVNFENISGLAGFAVKGVSNYHSIPEYYPTSGNFFIALLGILFSYVFLILGGWFCFINDNRRYILGSGCVLIGVFLAFESTIGYIIGIDLYSLWLRII